MHPWKGKSLENKWNIDDFRKLDNGEELFKISARYHIMTQLKQSKISQKEEIEKRIVPVSVKYQVLSKYTSFLGISKNDNKPIGELQRVSIDDEVKPNIMF